jgi:protein phosphatase
MINDQKGDPPTNAEAFEMLRSIAHKRLKTGRLTLIDSTNVRPESRVLLIALGRLYRCPILAIVLNVSERVCLERNFVRKDQAISKGVVRKQIRDLKRSISILKNEGFDSLHILNGVEEICATQIRRCYPD